MIRWLIDKCLKRYSDILAEADAALDAAQVEVYETTLELCKLKEERVYERLEQSDYKKLLDLLSKHLMYDYGLDMYVLPCKRLQGYHLPDLAFGWFGKLRKTAHLLVPHKELDKERKRAEGFERHIIELRKQIAESHTRWAKINSEKSVAEERVNHLGLEVARLQTRCKVIDKDRARYPELVKAQEELAANKRLLTCIVRERDNLRSRKMREPFYKMSRAAKVDQMIQEIRIYLDQHPGSHVCVRPPGEERTNVFSEDYPIPLTVENVAPYPG